MKPICPLCGAASERLWGGERPVHQCARCDVVWSPPPESLRRPEERWSAGYYERCYLPRAEALTADFRAHLDWLGEFVSGSTWLDVGCGGGFFARAAVERGWRVVGIDPSPEAIRLARATAPGAEFLCGTAADLPAGETFDVVSFWDSLFVVPDLYRALPEYLARLTPGGIVVVKTMHRPPGFFRAARALLGWRPALRDDLAGVRHACWHFTPESLTALLGRCSLEVTCHRWAREVASPGERPRTVTGAARHALASVLRTTIRPAESFILCARKRGVARMSGNTAARPTAGSVGA